MEALLEEMRMRYGTPFANGVGYILIHDNVPLIFDRTPWASWSIQPSEAAFEWLRERDLLNKVEGGYQFTQHGLDFRDYFRKAM